MNDKILKNKNIICNDLEFIFRLINIIKRESENTIYFLDPEEYLIWFLNQ